ncbi:hypothetical protein MSP8887_03944 [Marinomonas spartinae]|uniref:ABC transporter substrate-binding protein n=1 Tax=Marinomonas spartinae TaxID=1792290 RepID=UPI000808D521|nr:ABC transporter substrate-binding protein [Marinomonas spartinae]SBS39685.1 hypothetical protein MSP8887_03944 [Marinomonas spartinae]
MSNIRGLMIFVLLCKKAPFWLVMSTLFCTTSPVLAAPELGSSMPFTGLNGSMGKEVKIGISIGLQRYQNQQHIPFKIIYKDDTYDPKKTAKNIRKMIEKDHIIGMINNVGTPTAVVSAKIAQQEKILLYAPISGSNFLRPPAEDPSFRYLINYRSSYEEEVTRIFNALMAATPFSEQDLVLFSQDNTIGSGGANWIDNLLLQHFNDTNPHYLKVSYDRDAAVVENAVADLLLVTPTPKYIFLIASGKPAAKFVRLVRQYGLDPVFIGVSFVGTSTFANSLKDVDARVFITRVVPPLEQTDLPIVQEFLADKKKFLATLPKNKQDTFTASALMFESYISTRILIKALEKEPYIDQYNLIDALEKLGEFDLGLGSPLRLDATHHQASHSIWLTYLKNGQYIPIEFEHVGQLLPTGPHHEK